MNREELIAELEQYGTVEFCDQNNAISWVIVMNDVNTDLQTLSEIVNNGIGGVYPTLVVETLENSTYKTERNN